MSQQYSLRWNNHQPNFISMFTTLLNTQTLVDVTLAADGKQLLAHKVVLSACSTYFQSLFVDNPSPHPIVILKDVTYADLRTMVDFMYCGEVNVTEEQLPQVLDTAKLLKIKGLTEMPDSTCLTRSQGTTSSEYPSQGDSMDSQRHSPSSSPSNKRKRHRKSSSGSTSFNMADNENRTDFSTQTVESITLSSVNSGAVPQQRRMREYHEIRTIDNSQQVDDTSESENLNMEPLSMENSAPVMPQATPSTQGIRRRRFTLYKQLHVPDMRSMRRQASEPTPQKIIVPRTIPTLQKHQSCPQYTTTTTTKAPPRISRPVKPFSNADEVCSLIIRAVERDDAQVKATAMATATSTSFESVSSEGSQTQHRASHTPTVRSGPPLSCNFCWNTVDEFGRILRRKTQYHCPECRTNLCIVPCFHEYHDGPENDSYTTANAR